MSWVSAKNWLRAVGAPVILALALNAAGWGPAQGPSVDLKLFEGRKNIGQVKISGSAEFDPATKTLRMTASGENVWGKEDAFYFAWRKVSGDLILAADVGFVGKGKNPHRKAGWMVRQGLDADAPYAGVAVHGDGLITLHYRKDKGGQTLDVKSPIKGPARIRLERRGDVFALSVAKLGKEFQPVGALTVKLCDPVHAGLFVCSHEADHAETATFSGMSFQNVQAIPGKKRVQENSLEVVDADSGERTVIYRALEKFEAPNWSRDGKLFYVNRGGALFTLPVQGGIMTKLDTGDAVQCNNDHGLSPDGQWLAISYSVKRASQIALVPSRGGPPRRVTFAKEPSYWHGWSPDGTGQEQVTTDANYADWFPHPSPDGKWLVFLSYDKGVSGHPANQDVVLRIMPLTGGKARILATLFGGQGTMNVPSWSPDSKQIAFVSYLLVLP